ncbi:XRE family transcriptional regulator [Streptococcus uberis]|uniref:XRE family transcriptional regulator n=1 Tax=Streptococcus uberis TaxID=1349 RepID=UPI0020C0A4AD|nr:XRE family transcriptional regulator [Streptococcus uberis]
MKKIRLRELREELNLSEEELIELFKLHDIEMSIAHLNVYELHGIGKEVNWAFWENVAEVFDCDLAYLLNLSIFRRQADVEQQLLDYEDLQDEEKLILELKNSVRSIDVLFRENKSRALTEYGCGIYDTAKRIIKTCEENQNG